MANPSVPVQFPDSPRNGAWGDRPYALIDLAGPTSYVQVVLGTGTPPTSPTGGQAITPASFGLSAPIEGIDVVCGSTSGTYTVDAFQATNFNSGSGNGTWLLRWNNSVTGAEASAGTNLSNELIRLRAFGPY
jgi:hypothetical protein